MVNAQGEDVVAGIRNTEPIADLKTTSGLESAGEELERRVFLSGAQGGGEQGLAVFPRALADVGSGAQERRDHEGAAEAHRKS